MSNKNRQNDERITWLVDKLRTVEEERDNALGRLKEEQLENLSYRGKLQAIKSILGNEAFLRDIEVPENPDITDDDMTIPYAD